MSTRSIAVNRTALINCTLKTRYLFIYLLISLFIYMCDPLKTTHAFLKENQFSSRRGLHVIALWLKTIISHHLTVFVVKAQGTLMMSLCQFTLSELVLDCDLPITMTWSSRVRAQFVTVSAASAHLHHLCGTTFRLNWRPATLVDRVLNVALSHGFLSVPTRNRRLCELCLRGAI